MDEKTRKIRTGGVPSDQPARHAKPVVLPSPHCHPPQNADSARNPTRKRILGVILVCGPVGCSLHCRRQREENSVKGLQQHCGAPAHSVLGSSSLGKDFGWGNSWCGGLRNNELVHCARAQRQQGRAHCTGGSTSRQSGPTQSSPCPVGMVRLGHIREPKLSPLVTNSCRRTNKEPRGVCRRPVHVF